MADRIHSLLDQCEDVQQTGPGEWIMRCIVCHSRRRKMTVRVKDDGFVLVGCWVCNCGFQEVCKAAGLDPAIFFPEKINTTTAHRGRYWPFSATAALRILHETLIFTAVALNNIARGIPMTKDDCTHAATLAGQVGKILESLHERK